MIQFSPDQGATWQTLAADWRNQSYELAHENLEATTNGVFRVIASDGFLTASDDSDAAFSVTNNSPLVGISSPEDGRLYVGEQNILFDGFSSDPEDDRLAAAAMSWTSSVGGSLGARNGFSVKASALAEGQHGITLTGTDSHGVQSTATVTIRIVRALSAAVSDVSIDNVDVNDPAIEGANATYRLIATNNGPEPVNEVTLTFSALQEREGMADAAAPIASVSAASGWSCSTASQVVTCTRADLAAGSSAAVTVQVGPLALGTVKTRAEVSTTTTDAALGNNVVENETAIIAPIVGDVNGDASISVSDIFYLIHFLFTSGNSPIGDGDVNGDGTVSTADVIYLVRHIFAEGPPPQ